MERARPGHRRLAAATRADQRARTAPGRGRIVERRRRRGSPPRRSDRPPRSRHSRRASRTRTTTCGPRSRTCARGLTAASGSRTSPHRSSCSGPNASAVTGIEHLVLFPMYKQNASRDTCFEALVVRVPWPDWIAELERARFDNPEVRAGRAARLHARLRQRMRGAVPGNRVGRRATRQQLRRDLLRSRGRAPAQGRRRGRRPAGAQPAARRGAACCASPEISQEAYILWDLIHDRAHSHGDLPFDPFMIRQRAPYWMYALEELRCDLTAFTQALELEREGVAFARHVQYAILLDRLLRFPITGSRVRNYDGLGGQLLFAFLHRHDYLHWTDNRLTIEWDRVQEGVSRAARRGPGAVPNRHRSHEAPALGRGARPRRGERRTGGRFALGRGRARLRRRRGSASVRRPRARGRIPAVDLLQLAEG